MRFYKYILNKINISVIISFIILFSVLFIFSIIELLNEKYLISETMVIGTLNTLELLTTIPTILFLMSVIIFWILLHKTNELLIIRHYLSLNKIICIFLMHIFVFSAFEINKNKIGEGIKNIKEDYLKNNIDENIISKTYYQKIDNSIEITSLKGIDFKNNSIKNVSIFLIKDDIFEKAIYSSSILINKKYIHLKSPYEITSQSIGEVKDDYFLDIQKYRNGLYSTNSKITILNKKLFAGDTGSIISYLVLTVSLLIYIMIFLSKKLTQKNVNISKYVSLSFLIFIYSFLTSQVTLETNNIIFQSVVLLTFISYLCKIRIND